MIQRRKELRLTLEASEPIGIISEGVSQNFDRGFLINSAVDEIATPNHDPPRLEAAIKITRSARS